MPYAASTMGFPALPTGDMPVEVDFEDDLPCHTYSMPMMSAAVAAYPAPVVSDDGTFCYPFDMNVRNTFVHCAPRITSFDEFFQERQVRSCPASCVHDADGNVKNEEPRRHSENEIEASASRETTAAGSSSADSSVGDDFVEFPATSRDMEEHSIEPGRRSSDAQLASSKQLHFEAPGGGYASMDDNMSTPDLPVATPVYAVPPPPFAGEACAQVMAQPYPTIDYASTPCYPIQSQSYTTPGECYTPDATQGPRGQYPAHDLSYYGAQAGGFQMQNSGPAYTQHVFSEFRLQGGGTEYTCQLNQQPFSQYSPPAQHHTYTCPTGHQSSCYTAPAHSAPHVEPYAQAYAGPSYPKKKPDFGLDEPQHFAITQVVDLAPAPEATEGGGAMRRVLSLNSAINSTCSDKREAPAPVAAETPPEVTPEADAPAGLLPSRGSAGHEAGRCKPCAFMHTKGCGNGLDCPFCHLCEPGEKKKRRKEKLETRRSMRQLRQALSSGFGFGNTPSE